MVLYMRVCSCIVLVFLIVFRSHGCFAECSDNYLYEYVNEYSGIYFDEYSEKSPKNHLKSDESEKSDLAGLYVGLGVTCDHLRGRILMDDNMSQLAYAEHHPREYNRPEGYYYEPDFHGLTVLSANKSCFGGNISVGYGDFFPDNSWFTDNCYIGVEVATDVAGALDLNSERVIVNNRNNPQGKIDFGKCFVRYEGIVPTATLKFGGYIQGIDSLVFLRMGCKYLRYKVNFEFFPDQTIKSSVFTPIIGLGIEKNVGHRFSLKAEVDYSFRANKTHNVYRGNFLDGPAENYLAILKHGIRGYTARLAGVYHF